MIGIVVLDFIPARVRSTSLGLGGFDLMMTTGFFHQSMIDERSTAVSRYPPPLLRKSSIIDCAPDEIRLFHDLTNSFVVCSPNVATSMYPIFLSMIFSETDGILTTSRVTWSSETDASSHLL